MGDKGLELNQENIPQAMNSKELIVNQPEYLIPPRVQDRVHSFDFSPELQDIIDHWDNLPEYVCPLNY